MIGHQHTSVPAGPETGLEDGRFFLVLCAFDHRFGRLAAKPRTSTTRLPTMAFLAASTALCAPVIAQAGPVTVTNNSTTALRTTTGDGQGPGNITVDANGTITLSSGVPVTVDSDNDAVINGTLRNDAATNAVGLFINTNDANNVGRTITSNTTLGGIINIPGPSSAQAAAANNIGIRFAGNGTMQGNFIANNGSQVVVGGRESIGIAVDTAINGSFTSNAAISASAGGSFGIRTTRAISGNFDLNGPITMSGQDSIGALLSGNIGGAFTYTTTISTGTQAFFDTNGRRVDAVFGGPALWIAGSVNGGVLLQGNQVPSGLEATSPPPSTAAPDSIIASEGSNIGALRIGPTAQTAPGPMIIGVRDNSESLIMRGRVQSTTSTIGRSIMAMGIAGNGPSQRLILQGGIRLDGGNIDAVSIDATATGLEIGEFATVPFFINTGEFTVRGSDSTENTLGNNSGTGGGAANGITVAATSTLNSLINTGTFIVDARGRSFNAIALAENSGTLTYFENTGRYEATVSASSTGRTIAADLSRSTRNIDFRNSGTLRGDVTFGAGNDTFLSTAGTVTGSYNFGAGDDRVTIRNTTFTGGIDLGTGNHNVVIEGASKFSGGIVRSGGTTTFTASNSDIAITGGRRIEMTTGAITGTSTLDISIDSQNAVRPLIEATGRLVIDPSVKLTTRLSGLVTQSSTVTVISAGDLQLGIPIGQLTSASSSYIYGFQYRIAPTNRNQLLLDVTRRSAQQLGLQPNMGAVYENSLTALAADNELFSVIAANTTKEGFEGAISQLMPDASDASLYAALRTQNLAYGVIRNRLAGIPRTTGAMKGVDYSSFWVQQLGSYGKRDPEAESPGYSIYTVGIATGFDTQFTPNLKGGMSLSQVWSLPDETGTPDKATRISTTQLDFYGRHQSGSAYTQAIVGGSYNAYRSQRRIEISGVSRAPTGKWKGMNLGAAVDTGTMLRVSDFRFTPYLRGAYIRAKENSYTETDGGNGVNLSYDSRTQDSLRAGAGLVAQRRFVVFQDVGIEAELRGDVARELSADAARVTARFAAGGATFTNLGQSLDKNVFGVGASIGVRDIFTALSLDYDAEKSGDFFGHTISATFRFRF